MTHHRFPPVYTTKARKQDASASSHPPAQQREKAKNGSAGREFVDFVVSVHFRIVKRKQRLPHAKKESGTGSHHGRGDNVSLFP